MLCECSIKRFVCLCRKPQEEPESLPFDGTTTNRDDFDQKQIAERESFAPKRELPADVKFDGASTYIDDYDQKEIPERAVRYGAVLRAAWSIILLCHPSSVNKCCIRL